MPSNFRFLNILFLLDFYQLTNSTSDFKSRSKDVFDKLANLEQQHDVQAKIHTPISIPDEEIVSSTLPNPTIPSHAITFKKRRADDDTFVRPTDKWKKYDLDDVNEHHVSNMGNRHAFNDFLRTRVKPSITKETEEEEIQTAPIFKRPAKKQILTNEDDDEAIQFIPIKAPVSIKTTENDNDDDETTEYKLKSISKKPRGVLTTNEKKSIKPSVELSEEKIDGDDDEEDVTDELFEP